MKKTSKIHLVLVTAVLTSCNRMIVPDQPDPGYTSNPGMGLIPDSSLTASPVYDGDGYDGDRYDGNCRIDTVYSNNLEIYFNYFYPGRPNYFGYRADYLYRQAMYWRNHLFIARGGFGKAAASVAS